MARVKKTKGEKIGNDILSFIQENRNDLATDVKHGSVSVSIVDDVLTGVHFKLRSAMKQAGLTEDEIENALA